MIRKVSEQFDRTDPVCWKCFEDEGLQVHIREEGTEDRCVVCRRQRECITIEDLAELLDPILREHFVWGPDDHVFDGEDDDTGHWQPTGEPLTSIVWQVLDEEPPFH